MKAELPNTIQISIDAEFIINRVRFDDRGFIESRVVAVPREVQGSLRTTLSYLYLTDGPVNLPKDRFDLAFDYLEPAERIVARWLYIRTNANLRATFGREALLAARNQRYRCERCSFADVRALNLDHVQGRNVNSTFACLCANCHSIKSRQQDWTGARRDPKSETVQKIPLGAACRRWTLRADNNGHHHGVVQLSESPLYLELRWRRTAFDPVLPVGVFRLELPALLRDGFIRPETTRSPQSDARLRVVREADGRFFVQVNKDGPKMLLTSGTIADV